MKIIMIEYITIYMKLLGFSFVIKNYKKNFKNSKKMFAFF